MATGRGNAAGYSKLFFSGSSRLLLRNKLENPKSLSTDFLVVLVGERRQGFEKITGPARGRFSLGKISYYDQNMDDVSVDESPKVFMRDISTQYAGEAIFVKQFNHVSLGI